MEDILASIRRIIATDHYGSAEGAALGSLTRRAAAAGGPAPQSAALAKPRIPDSLAASLAQVMPPVEPVAAVQHEAIIEEHNEFAAPEPLPSEPANEHVAATEGPSYAPAYDTPNPAFASEDVASGEEVESRDQSEPLISATTGAVVTSSFQTLAETILLQDPEMIERLAREAIRPMLKAWLDENLPSMVERLVRAEIERVARGGRSRS